MFPYDNNDPSFTTVTVNKMSSTYSCADPLYEKINKLELENLELKCELSYYKRYSEFLEERLVKNNEKLD